MKKTELSAIIPCPRCKVRIMKAVTKIQGIDEVAVDAEKGKVTVIGTADPVRIVEAVRKTVKVVRVDSIGDHREEEPEPVKPPEEEPMKVAQPEPCKHMDPPAVAISFISYDDETPNCTIV